MNIKFFNGDYQDRLPVTKEMLTEMANDGIITDFTYDTSSKFNEFYSDELIASMNAKVPEGLDEDETAWKYDEIISNEVLKYCIDNYDTFIIDKNENLIGIKDGRETTILTLQEKSWLDAHTFVNS